MATPLADPASAQIGGPSGTFAEEVSLAFECLLEISKLAGSEHDLDFVLDRIVNLTAKTLDLATCSIYLWDEDHKRVVMRSTCGYEQDMIGRAGFERGAGVPGWVAENGKSIALAEAADDPRYQPLPSTRERDFHAYMASPLKTPEAIFGVMTSRMSEVHEFTENEKNIYQTIARMVANVVQRRRDRQARLEAEKLAGVAISLSGVAHYIKNVLVMMRGGEYLIDAGLKRKDIEKTSEGWAVLKRSNRKIAELVENMLNYYRETNRHPRPVEMNNFILEILEQLEERAIERNTVLTPNLDLRLEEVEFDPHVMQDAIANLVTNAIDAIPDTRKGMVQVQTLLDGKHGAVIISIIDNGAGIPEEDRPKLFNLFYTTKGKKGTGIGLAATHKIILDHGGKVGFDSEVGKGTTFRITIPLRQNQVD